MFNIKQLVHFTRLFLLFSSPPCRLKTTYIKMTPEVLFSGNSNQRFDDNNIKISRRSSHLFVSVRTRVIQCCWPFRFYNTLQKEVQLTVGGVAFSVLPGQMSDTQAVDRNMWVELAASQDKLAGGRDRLTRGSDRPLLVGCCSGRETLDYQAIVKATTCDQSWINFTVFVPSLWIIILVKV